VYIFEGFAPAAGPPDRRQLLAGGLLKWVTFVCKTSMLETLSLHFGTLSDHFGDPGDHRTPNGHLEARMSMFIDLSVYCSAPPGTHFGVMFVIFLLFEVPKRQTVSRSMFLMIEGVKCCLNPVAVRA